jgi:hypothetical protein
LAEAGEVFEELRRVGPQLEVTSQPRKLFGDRVKVADLAIDPDEVPLTLRAGRGLDLVCEAASRADITIAGLV